jgi:hypothetical protein
LRTGSWSRCLYSNHWHSVSGKITVPNKLTTTRRVDSHADKLLTIFLQHSYRNEAPWIKKLLGNEQIFRKGPLVVHPLSDTTESRIPGDLKGLTRSVLMAAFRPDRLAS